MDEPIAHLPAPADRIESAADVLSPQSPSPLVTTEKLCAAFASLQSELESIQQVTSEQEQRAAELGAREMALREETDRLCVREAVLREQTDRLSAREAEMVERESAVRNAAAEARAAEPRACDSPELVTRRNRLKKQRRLLSDRAAQLVRAKEALTNRLADTARTRTSLPLAGVPAPSPAAREAAPTRPSMMPTFGTGMLAASMSLGLIAGLSWWIAGVVDRPRYLAATTIGMADQAASAEPDKAESWSSFHRELAMDPQLLEQAAERLKRRGYAEFGTPSDLRRLLEESMSIDAATPGRLNLSMVGDGRLRTQRILETYTSILVGMANDSRERRADQSSTLVLVDAKAGDEPASDHRLPIFAMVGGAMSCLCLVVGLAGVGIAVGRRDRAGKNDSADEAVGGEDRWSIR